MSDPRYAPPSENTETPVTPLSREIMKWEKIYALTAIPINTLPATLPILVILSLVMPSSKNMPTSISILTIIVVLTLFAGWIYAGRRLSKLRQQKLRQPDDWQIPQ